MGPDAMILVFWMLSLKPTFSLSSFTFIKRLFSSSLSAVRVVSPAYLRLLIFLPPILIPACASSSPAFLMMYSEYKLNKQSNNIQPLCTPFPIWNQSVVPCPVLTVASWPAYRFLKRLKTSQKIKSLKQERKKIRIRKLSGLGKHLNLAHLEINQDPILESLASYFWSNSKDPVTSFSL